MTGTSTVAEQRESAQRGGAGVEPQPMGYIGLPVLTTAQIWL